jgi:hypothetical protein
MWNAQSRQIWQKSRPIAFDLASDREGSLGLGLTWTVLRRGSIVVKGAEAIAYAEKNGEPLYVLGDLGEPVAQVDFARAHQIFQNEPNSIYTTADPYYISEFIAVNPAKAQVVAQSRVGDNVSLSRAPGLGEDADAWWYYLESEGKPEVIDPENPESEGGRCAAYE